MKRSDRKASREAMGAQAAQARRPATRPPMSDGQEERSQARAASAGASRLDPHKQRYDRPG